MNKIPDHIREELRKLIAEKLPPAEIAFLMRLDSETVKAEIAEYNTTATGAGRAAE